MSYKPYDSIGKKLSPGDWVRIIEIPPGISGSPEETRIVFEKALGKTFRIEDFNRYGLAELNLTKKVAKFEWIWVEPHFLLLFRRKIKSKAMSKEITVYEKPTCTTCRKLANLFKENGIDYTKVNYFIDPLSEEKLRDLLKKAELSPDDVLRKNEPVYKELKISEIKDSDELIKLIVENPSILQRPIVEIGDHAVLARPVEKALELINSAK